MDESELMKFFQILKRSLMTSLCPFICPQLLNPNLFVRSDLIALAALSPHLLSFTSTQLLSTCLIDLRQQVMFCYELSRLRLIRRDIRVAYWFGFNYNFISSEHLHAFGKAIE